MKKLLIGLLVLGSISSNANERLMSAVYDGDINLIENILSNDPSVNLYYTDVAGVSAAVSVVRADWYFTVNNTLHPIEVYDTLIKHGLDFKEVQTQELDPLSFAIDTLFETCNGGSTISYLINKYDLSVYSRKDQLIYRSVRSGAVSVNNLEAILKKTNPKTLNVNDRSDGISPFMKSILDESTTRYTFCGGNDDSKFSKSNLLLKYGADIDFTNTKGQTSLVAEISKPYSGSVEKALYLLRNGANVNAIDKQGRSALLLATTKFRSSELLIQSLLKNGARVNHQDKDGNPAILLSVKQDHSIDNSIAKKLKEFGGNPYLENNRGVSACSYLKRLERSGRNLFKTLCHK